MNIEFVEKIDTENHCNSILIGKTDDGRIAQTYLYRGVPYSFEQEVAIAKDILRHFFATTTQITTIG